MQKGKSKMDNPEKLPTQTKTNKTKTICVEHHYAQAKTNKSTENLSVGTERKQESFSLILYLWYLQTSL